VAPNVENSGRAISRYPERMSANPGGRKPKGLTGTASASAVLSADYLAPADPAAVEGVCGREPPALPFLANAQLICGPMKEPTRRAVESMKRCASRLAAGRTAVAVGTSVVADRTHSFRGPTSTAVLAIQGRPATEKASAQASPESGDAGRMQDRCVSIRPPFIRGAS
jgi:hypothetical protein